MLGYRKGDSQHYPIASKIELISYSITLVFSLTFLILYYTGNIGKVAPSPEYVSYSLMLAAATFIIGFIATAWQMEKEKGHDNGETTEIS